VELQKSKATDILQENATEERGGRSGTALEKRLLTLAASASIDVRVADCLADRSCTAS
jgi:hypothetical protein